MMLLAVQLQVIKGKIKSSQSKGEAESLKFTEKNLINKASKYRIC